MRGPTKQTISIFIGKGHSGPSRPLAHFLCSKHKHLRNRLWCIIMKTVSKMSSFVTRMRFPKKFRMRSPILQTQTKNHPRFYPLMMAMAMSVNRDGQTKVSSLKTIPIKSTMHKRSQNSKSHYNTLQMPLV